MKTKIHQILEASQCVSFPELIGSIPGSQGNRTIHHHNDSLVVWEGVSEPFALAISELLAEGVIELTPMGGDMASLLNGPMGVKGISQPDYPVAKSIRKYRKTRWLPVSISAV